MIDKAVKLTVNSDDLEKTKIFVIEERVDKNLQYWTQGILLEYISILSCTTQDGCMLFPALLCDADDLIVSHDHIRIHI